MQIFQQYVDGVFLFMLEKQTDYKQNEQKFWNGYLMHFNVESRA